MDRTEQASGAIARVFRRPATLLARLSAGSLMALTTAAGFLPLFLTSAPGLALDPVAAAWLGSIGTNILAAWVQHFWEETRHKPPQDEDELLARLSGALVAEMAASESFRGEVARFLDQVRALDAARSALSTDAAAGEPLLVGIYAEVADHRREFGDRLSGVESDLAGLGYKLDTLLDGLERIRRLRAPEPWAPIVIADQPSSWSATLSPAEPFYSLPGRAAMVERLTNVLGDPRGRRILALHGLGGIGKTAVALELARRGLREGVFERVVGTSAKRERLVGETVEAVPGAPARLGVDELLDTVARQLGRWDVPTMPSPQKRETLRQLLRESRYLLLVDNLETAEDARALVVALDGLLDESRAIVTSRPRLEVDFVHAVTVESLAALDSLVFLNEEARSRNESAILHAPYGGLAAVHAATGGAPLAMKLVVGQASALPLDVVLRNLDQARGDIYGFIYLASWRLLSTAAKRLLIYMNTAATTCDYEELADVEIAESELGLQAAIREAVHMSLLDATPASGGIRYGVHALTHHFLTADLPALWREQGLLP